MRQRNMVYRCPRALSDSPTASAGDCLVRKDGWVPEEERGPEHVALGAALRALREEGGLSLSELARAAETDKAYLSGLERGRRNPSWTVLVRLTKALGITPAVLTKRAETLR